VPDADDKGRMPRLAVLMLVLVLAACGGDAVKPAAPIPSPSPPPPGSPLDALPPKNDAIPAFRQKQYERWLRAEIPGYATGPWYAGRPLLVTENDYALGVFNGDTGVVIDDGAGHLRAVFDRRGEVLSVRPTRLAAVDSLYAITIHKAQGSQFGSVVVVLPEPTSPILTRELLYTAVTRAQTHLTLVGAEASIRARTTKRQSSAAAIATSVDMLSQSAMASLAIPRLRIRRTIGAHGKRIWVTATAPLPCSTRGS